MSTFGNRDRPVTQPTKCRSCGAAVLWAMTRNAKRMPIDAQPVPEGNMVLTLKAGPPQALLVEKFYADKHTEPGRNRYTSHFSTCPNAQEHRRAE